MKKFVFALLVASFGTSLMAGYTSGSYTNSDGSFGTFYNNNGSGGFQNSDGSFGTFRTR